MMIIYIAGLQSIPSELIEAARIDGATAWQTLFQVKIPNVMETFPAFTRISISQQLFNFNYFGASENEIHISYNFNKLILCSLIIHREKSMHLWNLRFDVVYLT